MGSLFPTAWSIFFHKIAVTFVFAVMVPTVISTLGNNKPPIPDGTPPHKSNDCDHITGGNGRQTVDHLLKFINQSKSLCRGEGKGVVQVAAVNYITEILNGSQSDINSHTSDVKKVMDALKINFLELLNDINSDVVDKIRNGSCVEEIAKNFEKKNIKINITYIVSEMFLLEAAYDKLHSENRWNGNTSTSFTQWKEDLMKRYTAVPLELRNVFKTKLQP